MVPLATLLTADTPKLARFLLIKFFLWTRSCHKQMIPCSELSAVISEYQWYTLKWWQLPAQWQICCDSRHALILTTFWLMFCVIVELLTGINKSTSDDYSQITSTTCLINFTVMLEPEVKKHFVCNLTHLDYEKIGSHTGLGSCTCHAVGKAENKSST